MHTLSGDLQRVLELGDPVVVASRQRAVAVRLSHASGELRRGRTAWVTPDGEPLGAWTQACAARLRAAGEPLPRMLGPHEEWLLWSESAAELSADFPLLRAETLADGLARAALLAGDYRIPASSIAADPGHEAQWLARALRHVEQRAAALGALPRHLGWSALASCDPRPLGSRPVHLFGHGRLRPAVEHALSAWGAAGMRFVPHGTEPAVATVSVVEASEPASELRLAAEWCARRLQADPGAKLLLVVPDLGRRRVHVDRILRETLEPAACLDRSAAVAAFAFEGGQPLCDWPLPREALALLELLAQPRPAAAAVLMALEARCWPAAARPALARAARWLRSRGGPAPASQELIAVLGGVTGSDGGGARVIERLQLASRQFISGRHDAAGWADAIAEVLESIGWPGAGVADGTGQQSLEAWRGLLQQFADLGEALPPCGAARAVEVLAAMARREGFAPVAADTAVLVTAALEDPLVRYDGIWVCGLQADRWPVPARLDPYLPWSLQRRAGVDSSTAQGCLRQAREALAAWRATTDELCLSWAAREDEAELAPSPLLGAWQVKALQPALPPLASRLRALAPSPLQQFEDRNGRPWPAGQPLPRGSRSLELQNLCPFRAYAELRLGAEPPRQAQPGIPAAERGEYLHRVLDLAWGEIADSKTLLAMSPAAMENCVTRAAEGALSALRRADRPALDPRSVERERVRAIEVVLGMLALERQRAPFRVLAREWEVTGEIAGSAIRLRIDRVDAFEDGRLAIVDYKTGASRPLDWLGERADPVQLFTYARALRDGTPRGAVAALGNVHLVRRGQMFAAMTEADDLLPDSRVAFDWNALLRQWEGQVERLARAFQRGDAHVEPTEQACRRCHLHAACRRAELGVGASFGA